MLVQLIVNGFVAGCIYLLVGLGFALIYNTTRIFHIAHGAIFTAAGYLCFFFLNGMHLPLLGAILLSVLCVMLLGVMIDTFVYAPLEKKAASLMIQLLALLACISFS